MTETHDYKAALKLVSEFEVHTHGILFGKPLYGINPNDAVKTIRRALLIADKLQQEPSAEMTLSVNEEIWDHEFASDIFKAMRNHLLEEVDEKIK